MRLDSLGHRWNLAMRKETVRLQETQRRWTAMLSG
jgi:hypothetical protein